MSSWGACRHLWELVGWGGLLQRGVSSRGLEGALRQHAVRSIGRHSLLLQLRRSGCELGQEVSWHKVMPWELLSMAGLPELRQGAGWWGIRHGAEVLCLCLFSSGVSGLLLLVLAPLLLLLLLLLLVSLLVVLLPILLLIWQPGICILHCITCRSWRCMALLCSLRQPCCAAAGRTGLQT